MVATSYGNMKEYLWGNILDLNLMKKESHFFLHMIHFCINWFTFEIITHITVVVCGL